MLFTHTSRVCRLLLADVHVVLVKKGNIRVSNDTFYYVNINMIENIINVHIYVHGGRERRQDGWHITMVTKFMTIYQDVRVGDTYRASADEIQFSTWTWLKRYGN